MNRLAQLLFAPTLATALMSGLLAFACLDVTAWANPSPTPMLVPGLCSDTGCDPPTSGDCTYAGSSRCNTNNCDGCEQDGPGPDPEGACVCANKF